MNSPTVSNPSPTICRQDPFKCEFTADIEWALIKSSGLNLSFREFKERATIADNAAELLAWLKAAQEHLRSYREYSEAMRKIGRGHNPSSQFSPEYLDAGIEQVIAKATL